MIVAVFVSDRGDLYLPGCIDSYREAGGSAKYTVIDDQEHHLGMAGAVKAGFQWALDEGADYAFWVEEDFRFTAPIPLVEMTNILSTNPQLSQVVLKRQPWSPEEKQAGGQIELGTQRGDLFLQWADAQCRHWWVDHSTLFSLNPCLIPRRTLELEWEPGSQGAERAITDACLNAGMSFAYYGRINDEPRCAHVGYVRGAGYRW